MVVSGVKVVVGRRVKNGNEGVKVKVEEE